MIDPALSPRARGALVRALAEREHTDPFGAQVRISCHTIDRWARAWRAGGFEALVPQPAKVTARTPAEVLAVAAALKRENPGRTAAQVVRILRAQSGWAPSERTLQRHFVALALHDGLGGRAKLFGGGRRLAALSWESVSPGGAAYRRLEEAESQPASATANTALPDERCPPPICFALEESGGNTVDSVG